VCDGVGLLEGGVGVDGMELGVDMVRSMLYFIGLVLSMVGIVCRSTESVRG
jgi:hypothetical protein